MPPGTVAVPRRSSAARCPQAVWQCIASGSTSHGAKQCGSALPEFHSPLPPHSVAAHCTSSTAHCP